MEVYIRVKAAGKRRDVLDKQPMTLPDNLGTARELITHIVRENVRAYNERPVDAPLLSYLTQEEYETGEHLGKISFNDRKNERNQDLDKAVANALQCFEDGIYRLLINEAEVRDLGEITLNNGDTLTFIRLVMLAGRRW